MRLAGLRPRLPIALCIVLGCMCDAVPAEEQAEDRTLAAMCRAGLTDSAVLYARSQIELASSDAERRAKWTARLIECYAQAALRADASSQELWAECSSIYDQFVASEPDNGRLPWLKWQCSHSDLLRAQSSLARYLAAPGQQQPKETALELVRKIQKDMEQLEDDIKRRQPLAARQSLSGGTQAPADQLARLAVDVSLMRCESLLIRARLYDTGSRDRVAAATDVDAQASDVLKSTGADWPSRAQLQVAQAASLLELGRSDEALATLVNIARESTQRTTRIRAAVIAIEYLASHQQASRARGLLPLLQAAGAGAEFELASIQLELAELDSLSVEQKNATLNQLVTHARTIGERYGDYWRSRADALLTGSVSTDSIDSSSRVALDLMTVEVRQLLAAEQTEAAIQKLLQFRDTETAANRGESAIKLASQASALMQRQQAWLTAADAIEQTALQFPDAANASAAHALAIWSLAQSLRAEPKNGPLAVRYEQALRAQLLTWPDAAESEEPAAWLRAWLLGKQRSIEFAEILVQHASLSRDASVVQTKLLDWVALVLALTDASQRRELASQLQTQIETNAFQANTEMARVAQVAAFAFSQWPNAEEERSIDGQVARLASAVSDGPVRSLLLAVQLLRTTQRGRLDEAARLSPQWQPEQLSGTLRTALSPALVEAIDETPIDQHVPWAQHWRLDSVWADGLAAESSFLAQALGHRILHWQIGSEDALDPLVALAKANPRDGPLQMQLSNALADSGKNHMADSTRIARQVVASSSPGSELNFAARWRLLKNQRLTGSPEQAKRAAQLFLATQPIESEFWKQRFERAAQ